MSAKSTPAVSTFMPTSLILMVLGWGSLIALVFLARPEAQMRWLLFFATTIALTGTVMPFVAFLNRRFPTLPPPAPVAIVRQSLWAGIYVATLIWLQSGRVFSPELALLLAVGLALIESLLRLRERALWKPNGGSE